MLQQSLLPNVRNDERSVATGDAMENRTMANYRILTREEAKKINGKDQVNLVANTSP